MNKIIIVGFAILTILAGCKEKNTVVDPPGEEEVITTVTLNLTETGSSVVSQFVWEDIDGVGGNGPNRIDTMRVNVGRSYIGTINIENRSVTPAEVITSEIEDLADQHQFFFTVSNGVATVVATDLDSRSLPLGLNFMLTTGSVGDGTLTIALSHWESATAKNGTTPSDETDISVTFPLRVE